MYIIDSVIFESNYIECIHSVTPTFPSPPHMATAFAVSTMKTESSYSPQTPANGQKANVCLDFQQ